MRPIVVPKREERTVDARYLKRLGVQGHLQSGRFEEEIYSFWSGVLFFKIKDKICFLTHQKGEEFREKVGLNAVYVGEP